MMKLDDYVYTDNSCYPEVDSLRDSLDARIGSRLSARRHHGALAAGLLGTRTVSLGGYLVGNQAVERFLSAHGPGLHKWYPRDDRYLNCEVGRVELSSVGPGVYKWTVEYTAADPYYYAVEVDEQQNWENRLCWSCDFTEPHWTNLRMTTTANVGVSRHGANHGSLCVPTTEYGVHYVAQQLDPNLADNTIVSCAVDAVPAGYNYLAMTLRDRAGNYYAATFDLSRGTVSYQQSLFTEIIPSGVPNGWRCTIARSIGSGTTIATLYIYVANHPGAPAENPFAGDGSRGIYLSCAECQSDRWHARVSLHTDDSRIYGPGSGQVCHLYSPSQAPVEAVWTLYMVPSASNWYIDVANYTDQSYHMAFGGSVVPTYLQVDMGEETISGTGASTSMWLAGDFFLITPGKDALIIMPSASYVPTLRLQVRQRWLSHLS